MKNERPGTKTDHQHEWACQERSGDQGELATIIPLTPKGVTLIEQNPKNIEKVCPHGVIVCSTCSNYFNEEQKLRDTFPDLPSIKKRIIKPRPDTSTA